jgi:hypothetical protein
MKSSALTNLLLSIIALTLVVSTSRSIWERHTIVQAASAPSWEYTAIRRNFGWKDREIQGTAGIFRDGQKLQTTDIMLLSNQLGSQGWELVAIVPRSDNAGVSWRSDHSISGQYLGESLNGLTTSDLWIFRRAK